MAEDIDSAPIEKPSKAKKDPNGHVAAGGVSMMPQVASKKVVIAVAILAGLALLSGGTYYAYAQGLIPESITKLVMKTEVKAPEPTPTPKPSPTPIPTSIPILTPTPTPIDDSGISGSKTPTPTPTPVPTQVTSTDSQTVTQTDNSGAVVTLTGPIVKINTDDVSYTYTLKYNNIALAAYKDKLVYDIAPQNCTKAEAFKTVTSLDGSFTNLDGTEKVFTVTLDEQYLNTKTALINSTYAVTDKDANTVISGSIKVPDCFVVNESNSKGTFTISHPDLDKDDDNYHFEWTFNANSKARDILEDGFTVKMKHQCEDWVDDDYAGDWGGEWDEGDLGDDFGYAVNVDENAFDDVDDDDLYVTSTYKVYDHNDKEIFRGYVKVPNCQ